MRERQKLITERDVGELTWAVKKSLAKQAARTLSSKLASEKKKLEELSRALSRVSAYLREEDKLISCRRGM
jgi:hypothetical protein